MLHLSKYLSYGSAMPRKMSYYTQEVLLCQSDFDYLDKLENVVSETWNTAVLESGATNTVAADI